MKCCTALQRAVLRSNRALYVKVWHRKCHCLTVWLAQTSVANLATLFLKRGTFQTLRINLNCRKLQATKWCESATPAHVLNEQQRLLSALSGLWCSVSLRSSVAAHSRAAIKSRLLKPASQNFTHFLSLLDRYLAAWNNFPSVTPPSDRRLELLQ